MEKKASDWVQKQNFQTPKTFKLRSDAVTRTAEVNRKRRARLELPEENLETSGDDDLTFSQDRENEPSPPHRRSFTGDISLDSNRNRSISASDRGRENSSLRMEKRNDKWWQDSDWSPPTEKTIRNAGTRASPRHASKRVSPRNLRQSAGSTESTVRPDATFDKISENNSRAINIKHKKIDTTSEFELTASEDEDPHSNIIIDPPVVDWIDQSTRTIERGNKLPSNDRSKNATYDVFNTDTESDFSGIAPTRPPPPKNTNDKLTFDKSKAKKSFGIQFDAENMTLEKSKKSFGVQYEVENQTRYTSAKSSAHSKKTTRKLAPDSHSPLSDSRLNGSSSFQLSEDDDLSDEAMITLNLPPKSPNIPMETGRKKLMTKRTDYKTSERTKEQTSEHTLDFGKTRTIIKNESTNILDDKTKEVGKITSEDSVLPSSKLIKDQKQKMKNKSKKKKCQVLHDQEIIEPDVEVDENLPINDQILMNKLIEASEIDPTDITIPTTKANKANFVNVVNEAQQELSIILADKLQLYQDQLLVESTLQENEIYWWDKIQKELDLKDRIAKLQQAKKYFKRFSNTKFNTHSLQVAKDNFNRAAESL